MTDRNDTIASSRLGDRGQADEAFPDGIRRYRNHETVGGRHIDDTHAVALRSGDSQCESLGAVISEVEEFSRGWIGRIRQLIHRSSQLIERESLLAGAIARLDQQKAEWTKRTASKEEGLRDQAKRLTEAWLEVESERRKAIQGARAATVTKKSSSGPVVAAVQPVAGAPSAQQPVTSSPAPQTAATSTPVAARTAGGQPKMPSAPPSVNVNVPVSSHNVPVQNGAPPGRVQVVAKRAPVPNAPIMASHLPSTSEKIDGAEDFEQAEASKRRKIEEFKRMQRAIRSIQNK